MYRAEGTFNRAEGKKQYAKARMYRAEGTFNSAAPLNILALTTNINLH